MNAPSSDDESVIAAVVSGDTNQFNQLVTQYRDRVYRFVVKKIGDTHAAEDVTQDVFVAAFKQLSNFRRDSSFSTWLIGIALNLSRNHLNRDPWRKGLLVSDEFSCGELADNSLNSHASQQELMAVKNELDKLPEELRDALVLVAMEGFSYQEVALQLQVPAGTVKSRVWRAREALRVALKGQGGSS